MISKLANKLKILFKPNSYKIIIFVLMLYLFISSAMSYIDYVMADIEEEKPSLIWALLGEFFIWPSIILTNYCGFAISLIINFFYIYILSCFVYYMLRWIWKKKNLISNS
jgi:hypothetical protein